MDIYRLFVLLSVASICTSTIFDILQLLESFDIYLTLSLVFLFITAIIPMVLKQNNAYTLREVLTNRNTYFVPSTMLILVFKGIALFNASDRLHMTVSLWLYILGSFTSHYMKEKEYIELEEKLPRRDFFIFKPLVLTFAFYVAMVFHDHSMYERSMKYVLLVSIGIYAYSEILILALNELIMKHCCGFNRWMLIKPLHLVSASISLGMASFFYQQSWIPVVCIFVVIYISHLL